MKTNEKDKKRTSRVKKEDRKVRKSTRTKRNVKKDVKLDSKKEKVEVKNRRHNRTTYSIWEVAVFSIVFLFFGIVLGYVLNYGRDTYTGKKISKNLEEFIDTYQKVTENYYGDLKEEEIIESAINGMVEAIDDPYSSYMDENSVGEFNDETKGYYVGIGVTISCTDSNKIIYVNEGGPAEKAGLKVDDVIVKVDGNDVTDQCGNGLSTLIRGEEDTTVNITVKRGEEEKSFDVVRKRVDIQSVDGEVITKNDKKVGVLTVSQFSSNTYEQFNKELKKLEKDNIDSLIIDVRDNLGGQLITTRDILSLFFNKKTVLFQIQDSKTTQKIYGVDNTTREYPVAVLINANSASASEVVAACFKDNYKNVYIVGETSFGKGTVQKTETLKSGAKIKYTIQKWLTPKGKWIEGKGVKPTDEVANEEEYYKNPTKENDKQLNKAIELLTK